MTQIIHVLPDNVLSVLDMFQTSNEGINLFVSKVINEVEDGNINPLKSRIYADTLIKIGDKINQGTKEYQKTEAQKFGQKPFMFSGAELHYTATKTEYDFSVCNDPRLNRLLELQKNLDEQIKTRKEWLRMMGGPETIIDDETGEVATIYPPMKKQSMGVKVSIK